MSRNLLIVFVTQFIIVFLILTIGLRDVRGESNIVLSANNGDSSTYINVPIIVSEALIKNDSGTDRINEPVTIGIPLAEDSGIDSINKLGLQNVSAGQFRILDRWQNGNIKWVLADFQISLNAGETREDISLINGAGNFGGSDLATEDDSYIYVNTNNAQFTIKKKNFNMFEKVVVDGVELVSQGNSGGLYIQGENDTSFSSLNDPNSEVIVEENGPVRTVVKIMGAFTDSESNELMYHTVRMHFYKDKSYVKTFVTMRNANPLKEMMSVYSKNFKSMEVSVPVNLNGDNSFIFSTNKGDFQGNFADGSDNAYLFQSFSIDHKYEGPRDDCKDLNCMFAFVDPGLVVNHNGEMLNELGNDTEWTNSWAEIKDSTGKGMTMAMQWMSAYWPAGFDLNGDGKANIEFFSKNAQYSNSDPLSFGFTMHETRTLMFDFHTSHIDNNLVTQRIEAPIVARNQFNYYKDTKVIYGQEKIISYDEENKWRLLQGLTPFGSVVDTSEGINVWRYYWYCGCKRVDFGYKSIINFLRVGGGANFLEIEQKSNFNADYGTKHTDGWEYKELYSLDRYWGTNDKNKHPFQVGSFDSLHNHWLGMPIYYFISGDERIKNAIFEYGEGRRDGTGQDYNVVRDMRGLGRGIRTQAYLYEFINDPGIGEGLKKSIDSLLDSRDTEGSWHPGGRNLERGYLWQAHTCAHNPNRQISDFYIAQIFSDAVWCSYRILKDHPELNYKRIEELEDFQLGLSQFIYNELLFDDEYGFGYFYDYWLDEPNIIGTSIHPTDFLYNRGRRDSSRTMSFAYEQTGDEAYLTTGERLIVAGVTGYDTDMQRFHLIYDRLYKDNISTWKYLNNFNAQNNGGNNYTLTWTVPEGATEIKIKYSDKPIVDWLGFDQITREYEYSPDNYTAFFAGTNIDNEPAPLTPGTEQSFTIDIEQAMNSYNTVRNLTLDNPSYVVYDPNKTYYFAMKYEHSPESGDQAISPSPPDDDGGDTPPEDDGGGDTPPEDGGDTPPEDDGGGGDTPPEDGGDVEDDEVRGDLDGDGDIDRNDLNILLGYRTQPASACIACDLDEDGTITVLDARKLVIMCTRPRCSCE